MAARRYYVQFRGELQGPFSLEELAQHRDRGQLSRFHHVSEDRQTWLPAGSLPNLFPLGSAAATANVELVPLHTASAPPEEKLWCFAGPDGKPCGPVPTSQLLDLVRKGILHGKSLVWTQGMNDWRPLGTPDLGLLAGRPGDG